MNHVINLDCTPLSETLGNVAYIFENGNEFTVQACDFLRNNLVTPQIRRVHLGLQYYLTSRFDLEKAWENEVQLWPEKFESYTYETGDENAANANLILTDWIKLTDAKLIDALNNKTLTYDLFMNLAKEIQAETLEQFKIFAEKNGYMPYIESK